MKKRVFAASVALTCALMSTACQSEDRPVDRTPLPTMATSPYLCDYIPQRAVELMTGVRDPTARGRFDLTVADGVGTGTCVIRGPDGNQPNVLVVRLSPGGNAELIEEELRGGASPLPEIVPGAIGDYYRRASGEDNAAFAHLVRGNVALDIQLEIGVKGRDNAADVVALMKLIAPKLITDATAPTPSPSATRSSAKKD